MHIQRPASAQSKGGTIGRIASVPGTDDTALQAAAYVAEDGVRPGAIVDFHSYRLSDESSWAKPVTVLV